MKDEYLLVDGYNIIFAWGDLKNFDQPYFLEESRENLIKTMCNYQGFKGCNLILVFDAHRVKGNKGSIEKRENIFVVYTKEAETADNYIERVTSNLSKEYSVKVATSDRLEQIIIMGKGATRISATELKVDVNFVNRKVKNKIEERKAIKNNMLFDNLDPNMAEIFENMRRMK